MNATLKMKLGNKQLELTGTGTGTEIVKGLHFWSSLPSKCSCGSENISLFYKSPSGNDYYGLKCGACGAEFTFHQYKTGGFYTTTEDTWKKYVKGDAKETKTEAKATVQEEAAPF